MDETYQGSCLCGSVRYQVRGKPGGFFLCHCSRCRKATGSAYAANIFLSDGQLSFVGGGENVGRYDVADSRHARSFCVTCGAGLPRREGTQVVLPAGSLDVEISLRPQAHIFCDSRAKWDERLEEVPAFKCGPTSSRV